MGQTEKTQNRFDAAVGRKLDQLRQQSFGRKIGIILLSIVAALAIGAIFLAVLRVNPLSAYYYLLIRPFRTFSSIGEMSIKLVPILLVGIGVSFTFPRQTEQSGR